MYSSAPADARLETLIEEHRGAVSSRVLRLTQGDADWAEDVVQETFLRAWRNWEHMTPAYGSVRGWLMRVAYNLVMDGYRSGWMRRETVSLEDAGDVALAEQTDQLLTAHVVRESLSHLPEPHRRAIAATYLCDGTTAQAARHLNVPVGTVKSRVFYGLRMLRTIVDAEQPAPAAV